MKKVERNGFTLTELALVLMMFGIVSTIILQTLKTYRYEMIADETEEALSMTESAMREFRSMEGRYPCPANPALGPGDALYGREDCSMGDTPAAPGVDRDGVNGDDRILIGAVPFNTLLDPEDDGFAGTDNDNDGYDDDEDGIKDVLYVERMTMDAWKRKLTYAVSKNLTNTMTYNDQFGAIGVVDEHNQNVLQRENSAHFVIVSHGENGYGAYTREGNPVEFCNALYVALPPSHPDYEVKAFNKDEQENCNGTFKFLNGIRVNKENSYNDDFIRVSSTTVTDFWQRSGLSSVYNKNPGYVGIGTDLPTEQFQVTGNIKAEGIRSNVFCDGGADNCMNTEVIAGSGMDCDNPGEVAYAVENNDVVCASPFTTPVVGTCPAGEFMIGISNISGVICAAP